MKEKELVVILTPHQAWRKYQEGKTLIIINQKDKSFYKVNNLTHQVDMFSLSSLKGKGKEIYLDCYDEFSKLESEYNKKGLYYLMGILPLFISVGFFFIYFNYPEKGARISQNSSLVLALVLSYIGCHSLIKLNYLSDEFNRQVVKRFLD